MGGIGKKDEGVEGGLRHEEQVLTSRTYCSRALLPPEDNSGDMNRKSSVEKKPLILNFLSFPSRPNNMAR